MLLQFNVTNVLSFREEAILDFVADADNSHDSNLIPFKKEKVLPAVAVYGANAAGKSNLNKALSAALQFIRNSINMQVNSRIQIVPFLMDGESRNGKMRFDFIYVYEGIKYEYGFTVDTFRVYEEYLYEYRSAKPSMIFERMNVNEYKYTSTFRKALKQYEAMNTENKLFLATATAWNCKETEKAFRWFAEMIETYDSHTLEKTMVSALEKDIDGELGRFIRKTLKNADFNISDYEFSVHEMQDNYREWNLVMYHKVEDSVFPLQFPEESSGTKLYFSYCTVIYDALKKGKTLVIDEIDNGLHPMLVKTIVDMFNNREINITGAQLVFNTHDMELLDLDYFRRDQIYFVQKSNETGASELYSLADFSVRRKDLIHKGYMLGRYGALPNIGGFEW